MPDTGREYLQNGEKIYLAATMDMQNIDEFEIGSVIGEGATAVCYEAVRIRDGYPKNGTLKEFYPIESAYEVPEGNYRMVRDRENRQLCAEGDDLGAFIQRRKNYLESYNQIWKITKERKRSYIGNFIQTGEVYYGIGSPDSAAVYIWTSENFGIDMEQYLDEIREKPGKNVESKLHDILKIMNRLTICMSEIHALGYMHLDIKPSNILILYQGENSINPDNIALFDIDSLHYIFDDTVYMMSGTEGYSAPELKEGSMDNRSDIYSIGAVLFRAIVFDDNLKNDGRYCEGYYDDIDVMVKNSKLISKSVMNSDDQLIEMLADILKHCLAENPDDRYDSCSSLQADLDKAVVMTEVTDEKRALARQIDLADASIAIQKLLYDRPLYETLPDPSEKESEDIEIRALVVGCGEYGQKFMDFCLQAGQMRGYKLSITAISDRPKDDYNNYLRFRPDIANFVNVYAPGEQKGSMEKIKGLAYGTINFSAIKGADGVSRFQHAEGNEISRQNKELVSFIVKQAKDQDKRYHYVFVALGDDGLNRRVALMFSEEIEDLCGENCCPVGFVWEGEERPEDADREYAPIPVLINRSLTVDAIDKDLEQMTFNTDLVWSGESYENIDEKKKEFCSDSYRYSSSLSYVMSLKYKLYSLGISFEGGREQAAGEFCDKILSRVETDEEARENYDILAKLEHQRWILDRASEGWKAPRDKDGKLDLEKCVSEGMVKNPIDRTHPCMVFSNAEPALLEDGYTAGNRSKWDDSHIDPELDDLDRMSVSLHQCFRRKAEEVIHGNPLYTGNMEQIQHLVIDRGENVNRTYTQFRFCLQNILDGIESYARKYGSYKKQFQDSLNDLSKEEQQQITELLGKINEEFFPVIETNLYRDYKKNDIDLVRKIPYILTFRPVSSIALAFEDGIFQNGRNEAVFADVASATVLCPKNIYYLYNYTSSKSLGLFEGKVSSVLTYFNQRNMPCKVYLKIACWEGIDSSEKDKLSRHLEKLRRKGEREEKIAVLADYGIDDCQDAEEAAQNFLNYLIDQHDVLYDGSTSLFASAMENGNFVRDVRDMGIPYFEFDWRKKQFTMYEGCYYLQYLEDSSFLSINDMFSLMQATDNRSRPPEFMDDYQKLWEIYTTNAGGNPNTSFSYSIMNWNILCENLDKYEDSREPIAEMNVDPESCLGEKDMIYELPRYTFQTVNHILNQLIEYGFADRGSSLVSHTSENIRLTLKADETWETFFDNVFAEPCYLQDYYDVQINVHGDANKTIRFTCNSMDVNNVNLNPDGKEDWNNKPYKLLEKLQNEKYIRNLRQEGDKEWIVSFSYSSMMIKSLLTSAGRILEIYTYYEALKTGYFDDIVTGYEFLWEESGVKNELDLVLTKGFRSLFIECKAVRKLKLDYYHKLHSLAEHFGIGTIKVVVGNTYMQSVDEGADITNSMERSRGNQMNIITISNKDRIMNIGQTLKDLMENQIN